MPLYAKCIRLLRDPVGQCLEIVTKIKGFV